ncbi:MAG: translational GTPase TypA [Gammaproteobacteria bacterium]|nr:translational GTPase TypA [Gammaproteobacteria bacterium]MDE2346555.1 translational GTPase TypA [Gammaproteobacteria bacterium]
MIEKLRNIAIIAHVDHGKTTLVDQLLRQSGTLDARTVLPERVMDSNDLERERGITILAKNTAIRWNGYRINIVDTPGHADFGGEVERVLSMVDSVLLLVDAVDGPMPQTRFVTQKAFAHGLRPIVVINKIDRDGARPHWVLDQTFDLFDKLGASDQQLDFPVIYASALQGHATHDLVHPGRDMTALFETIVEFTPPPAVDLDGPFQMQVSSLDYSSYVGAIGIGRIARGSLARNSSVAVIGHDGLVRQERVLQVFGFLGLQRVEVQEAKAGDIVAFTGISAPRISDTLCDPEHVESLPSLSVDAPTISMTFETNNSPFAGQDGRFLTSRQVRERLYREALHNVALQVEDTADPEKFRISGRGELHLSILLETMRREGYEIAVSRPQVIDRQVEGVRHEPFEMLSVDIEERHRGNLMEALGARGGDLQDMRLDGRGRVRLDYRIPARGLIGFQTEFRTLTSGTGLLHHVFDGYRAASQTATRPRANGAMISNATGRAVAYALFNLQERGRLLVAPGDPVYEGQIVGIHARDSDLTVNPLKTKQLTNIRAAGRDENILLTPALHFTLEQAMEFIGNDELVEITPRNIRLRKRYLSELERKRASRSVAVA